MVARRLACILALPMIALAVAEALAEPDFSEPSRGPGYGATPWATVHGDSRNSDYVPIETPIALEQAWHVLEGTASWTAPSIGLDGTIYITTGRGAGTSHLHAIQPDGTTAWESAPDDAAGRVDSGAVTSAPAIDVEGDVYVGDADQYWAFHPDGRTKWSTELSTVGAEGPFVSSVILNELVGGITVHG